MNKQKLLEAREKTFYNFSDEAQQALVDMIDRAIEDGGLEYFYDAYSEITDDTFMYYSDAWDYMKSYGDTDFSSAVNEGFTTICQIAWYNLEQEFYELLKKVGLDSEDFEGPEEDEDDEEEE